MSGGLLHFCREDRSALGVEARGLLGGRNRAYCLWWQEGLDVFFLVWKILYILFQKSIDVTMLFVSTIRKHV